MPESGLTAFEHRALDLTGELMSLLTSEVVGHGSTREQDLNELAGYVHLLQHAVMAQAAARAHPDRYRLLGEQVSP